MSLHSVSLPDINVRPLVQVYVCMCYPGTMYMWNVCLLSAQLRSYLLQV